MIFYRPIGDISSDCERILRTLPRWFGIEDSLREYVRDAERFPTFFASVGGRPVAFLTVREHTPLSWEVHCMAVQASARGGGIGRGLHAHVESWLHDQGIRFMQVKTLAASHPSPEYVETRAFYTRIGYMPLEVFPMLWGPELPVLQLIKIIGGTWMPDKERTNMSTASRVSLAPMLSVRRGASALVFYQAAFGARILFRIDNDACEVVARLSVDGAEFWVADESPAHLNFSPESLGGGSIRLVLTVDDPDAAFERALRAGATVVWPVNEQHGWRVGRVVDPFGHHWEIGKPLTDTMDG